MDQHGMPDARPPDPPDALGGHPRRPSLLAQLLPRYGLGGALLVVLEWFGRPVPLEPWPLALIVGAVLVVLWSNRMTRNLRSIVREVKSGRRH